MSSAPPPVNNPVILGHVARPHGVHGAIIITPYGDNPELILTGRRIFLLSPDGLERRPVESLKGKEAAQGLIVKIKNITTREAASAFRGWRVALAREHLPEPADDEVYLADLIGLTVLVNNGRPVGRVVNLIEAGGGLILVIISSDQPDKEILVPYQEQFVVEVDLAGGRLVMDLPPGLLEL